MGIYWNIWRYIYILNIGIYTIGILLGYIGIYIYIYIILIYIYIYWDIWGCIQIYGYIYIHIYIEYWDIYDRDINTSPRFCDAPKQIANVGLQKYYGPWLGVWWIYLELDAFMNQQT